MSNTLRISLVQVELIWGNVDENLSKISKLLLPLKNQTDLIVLPEMFSSGFMMENKNLIAPKAKVTLNWMQSQARELNATLLGSIIVEENGAYFNRLYCVDGTKIICSYDKRHLFRMGEEHHHFSGGNNQVIFKLGKWRIRPLVCYDLRFPVWSRNRNDYDILLYVANWPEARREVWNTLLKARAIENQSFVAGVNRVGTDGLGLSYAGDSALFNAKGKLVGKCADHSEAITTLSLNLEELNEFRRKFPVHLDADSFQIS
ncbi:amidohydrolase [Labilibaculum filiforme]|uniref:Omega-amidase YafV n=1 Tax=Labilibaculum filiforme TaxID=1940526 RepID=A0A2N3HVH6_9BACT|nr:amidohydrolase [Labilibaculum filiforme]PKQ62060.1 amidohydrolase [Labilibaculum filiforme]